MRDHFYSSALSKIISRISGRPNFLASSANIILKNWQYKNLGQFWLFSTISSANIILKNTRTSEHLKGYLDTWQVWVCVHLKSSVTEIIRTKGKTQVIFNVRKVFVFSEFVGPPSELWHLSQQSKHKLFVIFPLEQQFWKARDIRQHIEMPKSNKFPGEYSNMFVMFNLARDKDSYDGPGFLVSRKKLARQMLALLLLCSTTLPFTWSRPS